MQIDESGLLKDALGWIVAGIVATIGWAVRITNARIKRLEDCAVRHKEFDELKTKIVERHMFERYTESAETARSEMRESILKLFDKVDQLREVMLQSTKASTSRDR